MLQTHQSNSSCSCNVSRYTQSGLFLWGRAAFMHPSACAAVPAELQSHLSGLLHGMLVLQVVGWSMHCPSLGSGSGRGMHLSDHQHDMLSRLLRWARPCPSVTLRYPSMQCCELDNSCRCSLHCCRWWCTESLLSFQGAVACLMLNRCCKDALRLLDRPSAAALASCSGATCKIRKRLFSPHNLPMTT